jgi:hypothetical protein
MLPEAIRALNVLVSRGKKVYVHCTAGINRATLTVVGYLTFVRVRASSLLPGPYHSPEEILQVCTFLSSRKERLGRHRKEWVEATYAQLQKEVMRL